MDSAETRTALFDLDETLLDLKSAHQKWAERWDAAHGLDGAGLAWAMREFALRGFNIATLDGLWTAARVLFGLDEPVERLAARYRHEVPELCVLRSEVRDGLEALRAAGLRVGIVTGGFGDMQTLKITYMGLHHLVDGWTLSDVVGVRKPDLGLFTRAVVEAGGSIDAGGWVIGNSPRQDIVGGQAIGFRTILIDQGHGWPPEVSPPDHRVTDVREAFPLILSAHSRPGGDERHEAAGAL